MVVSDAKLEANRRNAQKSTGPRTSEGKTRSSMNALKYGTRAETLVLPEEDPQELEDRRAAWTASLGPRCKLEQRAVDDAVVYSWRQDRARRAEATRANARLNDDGLAENVANEETVLDLGRRLFADRMGPLTFYPKTDDLPREFSPREASTSYPDKKDDERDHPAVLLLRLQSMLRGCEWLLGEWAKLKAVLDDDQPWISSDRLKAVRLLGHQPLDVLDDRDVALIYLASHRLKPGSRDWAWEILTEMDEKNRKRFRSNAADRRLESLQPADANQARHALLALIGRATERLTAKLESHRERERARAARAAALLAFDETAEGERLRRFEITSGRGYTRAIDTFLKLRRAETIGPLSDGPLSDGPLSVVRGPLLVGDDMATAIAQVDAAIKPAAAFEVDLSWALENDRNEPTAAHKNVTNEPTDRRESAPIEPADRFENATNEPTEGSSNLVANPLSQSDCAMDVANAPKTNEPTDGPLSVVGRPLFVPASNAQAVDATNEPTVRAENAPNEATESAHGDDGQSAERAAVTNDLRVNDRLATPRDSGERGAEIHSGTSGQRTTTKAENRKPLQAKRLRKPNAEAHRAAERAMAARRAHRSGERNKNGKPGGQPEVRTACAGQAKRRETPARENTALKGVLKSLLARYDAAHPGPG